jgi:hypothetical protein
MYQTYSNRDLLLQRERIIDFSAEILVTEPIDLGQLSERGVRLEQSELHLWIDEFASEDFDGSQHTTPILTLYLLLSDIFSNSLLINSDLIRYQCNLWTVRSEYNNEQEGNVLKPTQRLDAFFRTPIQCPQYVQVLLIGNAPLLNPNKKFGLEVLF